MHYKTIVLELLQARPALHTYLRLSRRLLAEMERYAVELRAAHHRWTGMGLDSGAALELALNEIGERIAEEDARLGA